MPNLREKLISVLNLKDCDEAKRNSIVEELTQLLIEKTMDDLMDEMTPAEMEELQNYIKKDTETLPEIQEKHSESLKMFFIIFNNNLNEIVREFQGKNGK